jgi:hypothetical protein
MSLFRRQNFLNAHLVDQDNPVAVSQVWSFFLIGQVRTKPLTITITKVRSFMSIQ